MFHCYAGEAGFFGLEEDLHFGNEVRVVLKIPVYLPGDDNAAVGIPDEDLADSTFRAVLMRGIPAALYFLLEDRVGGWGLADMVGFRPPVAHSFGEYAEGGFL